MGQRCLRQSFSCMYAHVYVRVACAPHPHPCHMGGGGVRCMSTWVGGGGCQHGWAGWMSRSEGGWGGVGVGCLWSKE